MKQPALKRFEYHNSILTTIILLVVTQLALTMTNGSAVAGPDAMLIAGQTAAQESKQTEVRELRVGEPVEVELKGGEAHAYRVTVTLGQYLRVVVEQKGIDVVVSLFGPDGKKLTEVDSPNGTQGPEPVSLIAPASGNYRVEVVSPDKAVAPGRYEIKIEALRQATSQDRERLAAERFVASTWSQATAARSAWRTGWWYGVSWPST